MPRGTPTQRSTELAILAVLRGSDDPVWFLDELEREIGAEKVVFADAIKDLACAGVVRLSGEFVKLARAARRTDELESGL